MKSNQKIFIAGMVIGALLILVQAAGFFFFASRLGAFVNVTLSSNPGLISSTNTIVLCTNIAGVIGWLLLLASVIFRALVIRSQSAIQARSLDHPGNP